VQVLAVTPLLTRSSALGVRRLQTKLDVELACEGSQVAAEVVIAVKVRRCHGGSARRGGCQRPRGFGAAKLQLAEEVADN
jgi:hypothetical protein